VIDYPDLALFVIDSNFIVDQNEHITADEQEQLWSEWIVAPAGQPAAWLERELERRDQRFKMVAMHHPPVPFGRHYDDWYRDDYGTSLREKRRRLLELLIDTGVQVVMSGHEHVYEHATVRRLGGEGSGHVLHAVVTSGGGAPVRRLYDTDEIDEIRADYRADGLDVDVLRLESRYHYSVVEVTPSALRIDTFEVRRDSDERPLIESVVIDGGGV
jgi:hypothetical protein